MSNGSTKKFEPHVPSGNNDVPETTTSSIILGILFSIIFCTTNAYLGLRAGTTISAGIPISILAMGIYKGLLKKNSILECNMVQSIGSVGESTAGGIIFTLPALFMWCQENGMATPNIKIMFALPIIGGLLGILFMIPLRKPLIVDEHGALPYPEGTACAEVLIAAEQGGNKSKLAFIGAFFGAIYKFLNDGLKIFSSQISFAFKSFKGAGFGIEASPALLGVGFIVGKQIACYMLAGGILGWFVIMPLIYQFGSMSNCIIYPATVPVSKLSLNGLWGNYLRYIGAGAVATGGIFNLIKSLPTIIKTFQDAIGGFKKTEAADSKKNNNDLSLSTIIGAIVIILVLLAVFKIIPIGWLGTLIILVFGFFFSTVASKMVGVVGVSNCPISGMTIATLLVTSTIFRSLGMLSDKYVEIVFYIGIIVCVISAISGVSAQTLKTGFLLGATPKKQEIGLILGLIASAFASIYVLNLLNKAFGFGTDALPSPQASLIKLVVEGVMGGKLPWFLVLVGVGITVLVELLGLPAMSFAIGVFLPISLTTAIAVGGFIRDYFDKKISKGQDLSEQKERGILFSSGLIAGEGIIGILIAIFQVSNIKLSLAKGDRVLFNSVVTVIFFALLCISLIVSALSNKRKNTN